MQDEGGQQDMSDSSIWDRVVAWTIAGGERVLAPIEHFIGRRSLVGDATFFPVERFPWVAHVEENWTVIRDELRAVLEDHEALPNFQGSPRTDRDHRR